MGRTSEDIMMALLHANKTKTPPVPLLLPKGGSHFVTLKCGKALSACRSKTDTHCSFHGRVSLNDDLMRAFANPLVVTRQFINPLKPHKKITKADETRKYQMVSAA